MVVCMMCMLATSFNVNPANVLLGVLGNGMWAVAGWTTNDFPLTISSLVSTAIFIIGIILAYI